MISTEEFPQVMGYGVLCITSSFRTGEWSEDQAQLVGVDEALSWLVGGADGYECGRRCPLELPVRAADGTVVADRRSAELIAQIEETRRQRPDLAVILLARSRG